MKRTIWIFATVIAVMFVWMSGAYAATASTNVYKVRDSLSRVHDGIRDSVYTDVHHDIVYDSRDALTADVHHDIVYDSRDAIVSKAFDKVHDSFLELCADKTGSDAAACDELVKEITNVESLAKELVKEASPRGFAEERVAMGNRCQNSLTGNWMRCVERKMGI